MASYLRSVTTYLLAQFDTRIADQETREQFYKNVVVFCRQQPFLASFLAIQLLFGTLPVLGLLGFALGVSGLAVGFTIFWIGIGLCVMFSVLAATATIATCVWISAVASLVFFRWLFSVFSGGSTTSSPKKAIKTEMNGDERRKKTEHAVLAAKADKNGSRNQKENESPREEGPGVPVKVDGNDISQKLYEEDTEGSDDTVGSYGALNQYTKRVKNEDLKWAQPNPPTPLSDAEKMRRDIERSLK